MFLLECEDMEFTHLFKGKIGYLNYTPPGSEKLAQEVAGHISDFPFLILKGHGIVVAGGIAKRLFFKKVFSK